MSSHMADGWPRLPDDLLAALPEHERALVRQHEEATIAGSRMQLDDICSNCHVRPQFAKTYRALRRDLRESLQKARAQAAQPHLMFSDAYLGAIIRSTDAIVSHKLDLMAQHVFLRWGEPIETWAGEEGSTLDRAGCSLLFLLSVPAFAGVIVFGIVLFVE